jgi:GT2 family glycosyltransferase
MKYTDLSKPSVTFVVVNWNQYQLTLDCLASLRQQDYPNFSVILVDNGSHDGSTSIIREVYPEITILENECNLGIAGANNVGIRQALQTDADYIFLLNNDTTVASDMLTYLVEVAESDPGIGMTGPTMLYFDQPSVIWCAGNRVNWYTGDTCRLYENVQIDTLKWTNYQEVDFITSCAVCIKRSAFEEVGLMDERYFIYYDETDWFFRAKQVGWRAVHVPWAKMWHKVSATMGESSPTTDYYMVRNNFLYLSKNLNGIKRISALVIAALRNTKVIVAYSLRNRTAARLRNRNAKLLAMRDAMLGRWGPVSTDVQAMFQ